MKLSEEQKKRIYAFAAYILCIILAIILFSTTPSGGTGGSGNSSASGSGEIGSENGKGNGEGSSVSESNFQDSENNSRDGESAKESKTGESEKNADNQSETSGTENAVSEETTSPVIDMTPVKTNITEDQKKIWKAAVDTTRKLCKYPNKSKFPEFGAKETEIIPQKSKDGIPCYKVKGFYVTPNQHGKDIKTFFECDVYFFQNTYVTMTPEVKE